MTNGDQYRVKAATIHAQAQAETDPEIKKHYEGLSRAYLRLAVQADRNAVIELFYEPLLPKLGDKGERLHARTNRPFQEEHEPEKEA